jgi:NAD(P)-dependent dehydrogenase (short-subunit alcohol dehydrogenase family)
MDLQLQGRRALVTGSTPGIGQAIAARLSGGCAAAGRGLGDTVLRRIAPTLCPSTSRRSPWQPAK